MTETGETAHARGPGGVAHGSGGGPLWWARRRSAALDITLAAVSAAECVAEGVRFAGTTGVPLVLAIAMGLVVGSLLLLRLRWPVAVVLVSIAVMPAEMGYLLGIVGLYTLAASEVPRRIIGLLAGMQLVGSLIISWVKLQQRIGQEPKFDPAEWFVPVMAVLVSVGLTAPPLLLGMYAGARRRLVESLRERADGLERELSLLADRAEERAVWARREERTRIAREMHDVVAHRVSLMVVHAAALQAVALKDPEKASKNAALVGDMGRQALTELRTMLGVLRTANAEPAVAAVTGTSGAGPGDAESENACSDASAESSDANGSVRGREAPARLAAFAAAASGAGAGSGAGHAPGAESVQESRDRAGASGPTLGELEVLVGQSRAAGMAVELEVAGEACAYSARVERTAYRVVQEALTNVHKHAAGAATRVRLAHRPGEVALQVENEPPAEGVTDAGLPSGGNGLVGMKERVSALGGVFVSGPTDAGGFRVSAVIPQDGAA